MKTSVLPHQTITSRSQPCLALNARMSAIELLGEIPLVLALLDVRAVEPLDVALVEHRRHRLDGLELASHLVEQRRLEHAGRPRRRVAVLLEDVPAAEHDVVEAGERDELVDLRRAVLGALAEPNRAHLRQRADRLGQPLADGHDAGDGGGADGAEADEQDAELAASRGRCRVVESQSAMVLLEY